MSNTTWLALLAGALLVAGCGKATDGKPVETNAAAPERGVAVTVTEARAAAVPIVLEVVGEVQSIAAPKIGAEIAGRVTRVLVDVGDVVAQGDELGQLDRSSILLELDVARAERGRVEAMVANQDLVVKRQRGLKEKNFVSTSAVDEAEAQLRALHEELEVAKARVALAEYRLRKSTITAPLAGKVDARFVSVGDYVKDGASLFTLADTEALRLVMVFPEPAMNRLRKGIPLKVMTAVNPGLLFDAVVTEIRPQVESANKGVVVYAALPDPGLTRAGSSATAWATLEVHENAVVVPQLSLVRRPAGEVVYVIGADNRAVERKVVSGARLESGIEIVEGLQPGERVAVDGAGFLSDGVKVALKQ